jgi:arginine deiminase
MSKLYDALIEAAKREKAIHDKEKFILGVEKDGSCTFYFHDQAFQAFDEDEAVELIINKVVEVDKEKVGNDAEAFIKEHLHLLSKDEIANLLRKFNTPKSVYIAQKVENELCKPPTQ